jgi:drug/metabolite transporter (DMT)-like permease
MYLGIGLGILGYALYSTSDAAVKAIGHGLSPYQVGFIVALMSLPLLVFTTPRQARIADVVRASRPGLVLARGVASTIGGICSVLAFQSLPFAEAYSILFLLPSFANLWAIVFLKERVSPMGWLGVAVGLAGVVLVVRPSFETLQWAHAAALGGALAGSASLVLLRDLNRTEKAAPILFYSLVVALVGNGVLMLQSLEMPTAWEWGFLALSAAASGAAQIAQIAAARRVAASRIVPGQYTQILWALIIGGLFFGEFPDWVALVGIGLVVASGLVNFLPARAPNPMLKSSASGTSATLVAAGAAAPQP